LSADGQTTATGRAHARAALLGNPSDGFGGATIGFAVRDFAAHAEARHADRLEIVPAPHDGNSFADVDALLADVEANGYYGGLRLVKAAIKRFAEHARVAGAEPLPTFTVSYATTIPRQVGLGGSSAIVIATLRALCGLNGLELDPADLARLALSAEAELGIPAGLQDRVIQAYDAFMYMDFRDEIEPPFVALDPAGAPPMFIAFRTDASEPSAAVHSWLRSRFNDGDPVVVDTMREIAGLAEAGREAIAVGDHVELGRLMRANVEARARLLPLDPRHLLMVEVAESLGAPANYTGSGGAIVGLVPESGIDSVHEAFAAAGCGVIAPTIVA
jgi:glucuronokinase